MPELDPVVLAALTNVAMPAIRRGEPPVTIAAIAGMALPVVTTAALVVGSGAAGLRAAVELHRRGVPTLVASMSLFGGTSACSGSDKQTLHTCGTSRLGDDFTALAKALGSGGCMDADTAYVEAVGSIHTLAGLQYLGLPVPTDRFGAALRYQTDHDNVGRATSCGPRTSRLMVKVLAEEVVRLGIPCLRTCEAIKILTTGTGADQRVCGILAIDRDRDSPHGLVIIRTEAVVLATGGPGELYRDSVYPAHCYGSLGMAIEAGIQVCNLTESQFGIGTRREDFPWNLSGTYVQAMPHIFSRDAAGNERHFLADWYRTTAELAANIFRKGYQWPFHASRMLDFGSSLVDLAIAAETRAGRTVYLDFSRNPLPGADGRLFAIADHAAPIQCQQSAYEWRSGGRYLERILAVRLLRHRRGGRHPWRDPSRRRRIERGPGRRPARRRAYRCSPPCRARSSGPGPSRRPDRRIHRADHGGVGTACRS